MRKLKSILLVFPRVPVDVSIITNINKLQVRKHRKMTKFSEKNGDENSLLPARSKCNAATLRIPTGTIGKQRDIAR